MAADPESEKNVQPLDLIFSCSICHDSIRDIETPVQERNGLEGARRPVAKLWMTECAHLICTKHLEGGAPPFHPAGTPPRAVCPVCVTRQNNHTLRQMYAIGGYAKGEYDPEIPHHFFQCPPVALNGKEVGMDALRFQFLNLVTYGIAVATKFRSLHAAHSHLKDQTEKLKLEKTEAETEVHALTERISFLEETEREHQEKQPEIRHYLHQFALMKRELDRRNEDLRALGYLPPRIDYTFPPPHLYEDDAPNGDKTTSDVGHGSRRVDQSVVNTFAVDNQVPSVSSTTLRGDSSRACAEDESKNIEAKRQKLSEFRYQPQVLQPSSIDQLRRKSTGLMLPPGFQATRTPTYMSNQDEPIPASHQTPNNQVTSANERQYNRKDYPLTYPQGENLQQWNNSVSENYAEVASRDLPYMSGALDADNTDSTHRTQSEKMIQPRIFQPIDDLNNISSFTYVNPDQSRTVQRSLSPYHSARQGNRGPMPEYYAEADKNLLPVRGTSTNTHQYQFVENPQIVRDTQHTTYQSPYHQTYLRPDHAQLPVTGRSNRPATPSPQKLEALRLAEGPPVASPFFRSGQSRVQLSRRNDFPTSLSTPLAHGPNPSFRVTSPRKLVQKGPTVQARTLNGLSFIENPYLDSGYSSSSNFDKKYVHRGQESSYRALRDPSGFFIRSDVPQSSISTASPMNETYSSRHYNRAQPLPSANPSLEPSLNTSRSRRNLTHDGALANVRGVKGAFTYSKGTPNSLLGSRQGMFSSSGRRSVRR